MLPAGATFLHCARRTFARSIARPRSLPRRAGAPSPGGSGDGGGLSLSEQSQLTRSLLCISTPTWSLLARSAGTAACRVRSYAPPAEGAAWLALPRCGVTAALSASWALAAGEGQLLALPFTQVVAGPPLYISISDIAAAAGAAIKHLAASSASSFGMMIHSYLTFA